MDDHYRAVLDAYMAEVEANRERERHKVPYGALLLARDGETVKPGHILAT